MNRNLAATVIEDTEKLSEVEREIGKGLRAGGTRAEVFKRNPRFANIRPAHPPKG